MNRLFRFATYTLLLAMCLGCEAGFVGEDIDNNLPPSTDGPTTPIKRRPIVPPSKLPRPRIIETIEWLEGLTMRISLCEAVPNAEVMVRNMATGATESYIFIDQSVDITIAPDAAFEITIYADGQSYSYIIE